MSGICNYSKHSSCLLYSKLLSYLTPLGIEIQTNRDSLSLTQHQTGGSNRENSLTGAETGRDAPSPLCYGWTSNQSRQSPLSSHRQWRRYHLVVTAATWKCLLYRHQLERRLANWLRILRGRSSFASLPKREGRSTPAAQGKIQLILKGRNNSNISSG